MPKKHSETTRSINSGGKEERLPASKVSDERSTGQTKKLPDGSTYTDYGD